MALLNILRLHEITKKGYHMDIWLEILQTIKRNKLRTFFTGFSVAWGIFMLIILLAAGNGLKNGIARNFEDTAVNSIGMWPGNTTVSYEGLKKGRRIKFDNQDTQMLENQLENVIETSPMYSLGNSSIRFKNETSSVRCEAIPINYATIRGIRIEPGGRLFNDLDMREKRRVALIHKRQRDILFKDEDAIGENIIFNKMSFQVVGIYDFNTPETDGALLIPLTTAETIYNANKDGYRSIYFTLEGLDTKEANETFIQEVRARMGRLNRFDPDDKPSIWIWNKWETYLQTLSIMNGIKLFIWIIGIGTLIAGVVGISNIMLITVKERTKEIGIRKAIGATPGSILRLILLEAIIITSAFGYVGIVAGVLISETINTVMQMNEQPTSNGEQNMSIFYNPTVDINIVLTASLVIIIAGLIAGYIPAKRAVSVKPIEALHYE
ncbi:MAG: ABC transporter permease [Bacteroidales bacterium]